MKKYLLAAILFILTIPATSQAGEDYSVIAWESSHRLYTINLQKMQRKNRVSYVPINQTTNDVVASTIALDVMEKFEKENPGLKIVSWYPVYMTPTSLGSTVSGIQFVGIYITHDIKKK